MRFVRGLVSVVIVTYNQERLVAETIRSVLDQTYKKIEVIVADDASSDGTLDVIRRMAASDSRIKWISAERNTGITENCNRGLRAAQGEFIAWLGGDDVFLPEKIQKQVEVFRDRPSVTLVGTDVDVFFEDGSIPYTARCKVMSRRGNAREFLRLPGHIPTSSFMFRRDAVSDLQFDSRLKVVSDWLFNVECALAGDIDYVPEPLTRYRRWSNNVTASGKGRAYLDDRLISTDILLVKYPELSRDLAIARSNAMYSAAKRSALDRDYKSGSALAMAAVAQHTWQLRSWMLLLACWFRIDLAPLKALSERIRGLRKN